MAKRAQVFAVPMEESGSGKDEVIYAEDGNLNKGKIKTFGKNYAKAVEFAHKKGKELGAEVTIHPSKGVRGQVITYPKPVKAKSPSKVTKSKGRTTKDKIRKTGLIKKGDPHPTRKGFKFDSAHLTEKKTDERGGMLVGQSNVEDIRVMKLPKQNLIFVKRRRITPRRPRLSR